MIGMKLKLSKSMRRLALSVNAYVNNVTVMPIITRIRNLHEIVEIWREKREAATAKL